MTLQESITVQVCMMNLGYGALPGASTRSAYWPMTEWLSNCRLSRGNWRVHHFLESRMTCNRHLFHWFPRFKGIPSPLQFLTPQGGGNGVPPYQIWTLFAPLIYAFRPAFRDRRCFFWACLVIMAFCTGFGPDAGVAGMACVIGISPNAYTSLLAFFFLGGY